MVEDKGGENAVKLTIDAGDCGKTIECATPQDAIAELAKVIRDYTTSLDVRVKNNAPQAGCSCNSQ